MSFKRSHVRSLEDIPNSAMTIAKGLCKNYFWQWHQTAEMLECKYSIRSEVEYFEGE